MKKIIGIHGDDLVSIIPAPTGWRAVVSKGAEHREMKEIAFWGATRGEEPGISSIVLDPVGDFCDAETLPGYVGIIGPGEGPEDAR